MSDYQDGGDPRLFEGRDRGTLQGALDEWGPLTQEDHAVEELGELLTAIMQHRRGRVDDPEVRDEIADVLIVVNQLALMYGAEGVENQAEYKMCRLRSRLQNARAADE